ncbi:MAG: hypothetical protein HY903_22760 [Deltaproteobacteria bacterium]|nr:hypothetical protein [Deltaproteobacteria bacterium]
MKTCRFPVVVLLVVLVAPQAAWAAACCMSAAVFGVGRLKTWEELSVGTRFTYSSTVGTWDPEGLWLRNPIGYSESESRADLFAIYRLAERWQVSALLPGLRTVRDVGAEHGAGGGLGDGQASVRFEPVGFGEYPLLPAIGVTATVQLPTGRRVEDSSAPLDAGATGRGAWGASLSAEVEKVFFGDYFARADLGFTYYLPFTRSDLQQRQTYGPTVAGALSCGMTLVDVVALGLMASYAYDAPYKLDGAVIDASAAATPAVGVNLSWNIDDHWTLLGAAGTAIFASRVGMNRPGRLSAGLGLRYGYF